jgi:acyl-CoA synthetase (AMP-forming)/AMP-acid ligase II
LLGEPAPRYVATSALVTNLAVHFKWGRESSRVWVTTLDHAKPVPNAEIRISGYCKGKIAGYKVPKSVVFIKDDEMPRIGPGKIFHRALREKYGMWKDHQ